MGYPRSNTSRQRRRSERERQQIWSRGMESAERGEEREKRKIGRFLAFTRRHGNQKDRDGNPSFSL